jgi:hypothetical protein
MLSTRLFVATVIFDEGRRPPGSPAFWLLDSGHDASIFGAEQFFNRLLTDSGSSVGTLPGAWGGRRSRQALETLEQAR